MEIGLESELNKTNDDQKKSTIKEYMDFGLIIREESEEINEEIGIIKKWYTGYISLLNLTVNNGTHNMSLNYNDDLHKFIDETSEKKVKNLRNVDEANNSQILSDENELCFVKINFYENGETKDIFIPNGFNEDNMIYIDKIVKLIIPKLSIHLYTEDIDFKIRQIDNLDEENNEEEEMRSSYLYLENDSSLENSDNADNIFEDNIGDNSLRRNSENDTTDNNDFSYDDYGKELEIEKPISSSDDDSPKYHLKGIDENETFTTIIDFEKESLEGTQAKLEGSNLRIIKNTFIDEKGMLVLILEQENITIIQPDKESLSDLTEEEDKLKSEIYNDNNEIPRDSGEDFMNQNISFEISNIKSDSYSKVSLYENINDEKLAQSLFSFFDSFSYSEYHKKSEDELRFRVLKDFKDDLIRQNEDFKSSEIEMEHSKLSRNKKTKRKIQSNNAYYGMKNFEKEKVLFKYNLIGLILEGIVVSKIDVSTGVTDNYLKLTLGFLNLKIKFSSMQTNLHIITKNTHQMTYNFMGLLYNSNEELIQRNTIYSDIIIELEKNVSNLFEKYYDYSGLFRDSLEFLYDQVKNFSGQIFDELISLIERVYDNYTIILNQSENNEYEILNEIRNVTKNEYLYYIDDMFNLIISFKNDTILFLEDIKHEVDLIQTFQLDVLYDIVDIIDDGIKVFREFIKKLFKAVERGVNNFKYDLRDYMEEKIGELLYLTDFLSININKNEILKNAIDLEKRQNITVKLKDFRNIILRIEQILNDNIINDYEEEMSIDNKDSVKFNKEFIILNSIEEIDNKTIILIEKIKIKIQYMNYYENYANNIQIINEIINKSLIEFNNDIYNQVLNRINDISPEYINKSSDLINKKNYLFSLSNDIVNNINQEIIETNNYIGNYSKDYIDKNNYELASNLHNYKKFFSNEYLSSRIDEFRSIVKEALQVQFIKLTDENYDLSFQYMEEVLNKFKGASSYKLLGNIFIDIYTKYKAEFTEISYLTSTDEFLNFIEEKFYNVSNYILNYINEKINSINKYYFHEKNKDNFYKLELIQEEIFRISDNLNNYFNEMTLETDIKMIILNISLNEIQNHNTEKEKKLDNYYNTIYNMAEKEKIHNSDCDIIQLIIKKKEMVWEKKVLL